MVIVPSFFNYQGASLVACAEIRAAARVAIRLASA